MIHTRCHLFRHFNHNLTRKVTWFCNSALMLPVENAVSVLYFNSFVVVCRKLVLNYVSTNTVWTLTYRHALRDAGRCQIIRHSGSVRMWCLSQFSSRWTRYPLAEMHKGLLYLKCSLRGSYMRDDSGRRQSTVLCLFVLHRVPTSFILDLNPSTCAPSSTSPFPTRTPWGAPSEAECATRCGSFARVFESAS